MLFSKAVPESQGEEFSHTFSSHQNGILYIVLWVNKWNNLEKKKKKVEKQTNINQIE